MKWALPGTFTSYTPTWTNLTVGNGTNIGQYYEDAEQVTILNKLTFGSTTSISGSIRFSLPVNAQTKQLIKLGGWLRDTGSGDTVPWIQINDATTAFVYWPNVDHVNSGVAFMTGRIINATTPWTWAVNDEIVVYFTYEKA